MTAQAQQMLNEQKMNAFAQRYIADSSAAFRAALGYIGDRLEIFKGLSKAGPVTTGELAQQMNLNERYLKEWLSAMAAAQYVEYDAATGKFSLPAEHAMFLSDDSSPMYCGGLMQMTLPLWKVVPKVSECFVKGGGVHHDHQELEMTEAIERFTRQIITCNLVQQWIPAMPELESRLKQGVLITDVGCGAGQAAITMAKAYPKSNVIGYDNHGPSIERAKAHAVKEGVKNVQFEVLAIEDIPQSTKFDFVTTFDVIHDMADPVAGLKSIKRILAPGGTYMMVEMNVSDKLEENINPLASMLYSISTLYCMTVSLAENGAGIGACMGENRARKLSLEAGFKQFSRLPVEHPFNLVYELK